jgi:phage shock protein A
MGRMGLFSRMRLVFRGKANRALDRMENPADALDLAYDKQLEAMQKVRRGIADVVTAQKQLEIQQRQMEGNRTRLDALARQALEQHREELAASALTQSELVEGQLAGLRQQMDALSVQRDNLEVAGQRLQARLAAMRTQKETLKAQYSAAQATVHAGETVTGISKEMDEVTLLLERARDKMLRTQARAEAVNELMDTGVMSRLGAGGIEGIEAQVRATSVEQSVDQRLRAMKRELGLGAPAAGGRLEAPAEPTVVDAPAAEPSVVDAPAAGEQQPAVRQDSD